jgi:DNA-binding transcriptional MerR regulator
MKKSPEAFRTISEVAEWLDTPAYVLRFWESCFSQIKPVKRAGGRRYYRPYDMLLLGGIKQLLHFDEKSIDEAKIILKNKGIDHVIGLSHCLQTKLISPTPKSVAKDATEINEVGEKKPANKEADELIDLVSDNVRNAPFRIASASAYNEVTMAKIETLYYSLRMARNSMQRGNKHYNEPIDYGSDSVL